MTASYLVIYYDGNETKSRVLPSEYPNSSQPHVWGLPDDHSITAVVAIGGGLVRGTIYIDEEGDDFIIDNRGL